MRSMVSVAAVLALVLVVVAHDSSAQTYYECFSKLGQREFSEEPCDHPIPPGSGQSRGKAGLSAGLKVPLPPTDKSGSRTCLQARRAFDAASRVPEARFNDVQDMRVAMHQACGIKSPPEVTIIRPPQH